MIRILTILSVAVQAAGSPALAGSRTDGLERANAAWIATINSGRLDRAFAGMTRDSAIISATGSPVIGHDEVGRRIAEISRLPRFHVDFVLTRSSVSDDGTSGIVIGDSVIGFDNPDGTRSSTSQRLLTVWRRAPSGRWACYLDVVMSEP